MSSEPAEPPSPALLAAELDRIAASDSFARSARQVRFLRHLVAATQAGDAAALREMALGMDVFLRDPARYDPRADSIVRVEARRLRKRLAAYYADEGLDARLEFRLAPRSFRVEVLRRDAAAARPRASVAVFDFDAAADLRDAARACRAELVAWLVRLNGLRVVAGGRPPGVEPRALREAARALDVAYVLTTEYAAQAGVVSLQVRLTDVQDGRVLATRRERLDATAEPLLPLARSLVAELHRAADARRLQRIGPASALRAPAAGAAAHTAAAEAAAAQHEQHERLSLVRVALLSHHADGAAQAVRLAQQAVQAEPADARALALLAEALAALAALTAVASRPALQAAGQAAEQALALDPDLPSAHGVLGQVRLLLDHDWPRAEARLLAALRCAPGLATAHARYGWALMLNRRFAEARAAYAEARALDPLSTQYRCHEALVSAYEHDWPRAAAGLDTVLAVAPDDLVAQALRAAVHLYAGDAPQALAAYTRLRQRWPALSLGDCGLAQAHALLGERDAALRHLAALQAAAAQGWVSPYQLAMVHTRLGEETAALEALDASAESADANFICVGVDPAFDAWRGRPAFQALLRRHGLGHLA